MKKLVILMAVVMMLMLMPTAYAATGGTEGNALITIAIIFGAVVAVCLGIYIIMPKAIKRGVDMTGILSGANSALSTAQTVVEGLKGIMPDTKGLIVADKIITYAKAGVDAAEEMYLTAKIDKEARGEAAKDIIYGLLEIANIPITPDIDKLIDGCVDAAVLALPKTSEALALKQIA